MKKASFEDWKKLEIKVGKIIQVDRVPDADKLYKILVDIGEEEPRQIVSGIVPYYKEDELVGKLICVITNLESAKFRGVESNGMLLAASNNDDSQVILLSPEKAIDPGAIIT